MQAENQAYNSSNQLVTGGLYAYDDNGNRTVMSTTNPVLTTNYTWDYENRMTGISRSDGVTATYKYDPFGRRIQKVTGSVSKTYLYDGAAILEELDATGVLTTRYLHGPGVDEPWMLERGSARYFYTADNLGSITGVLNSAGTAVESNVYLPFGEGYFASNALGQPFGYTGREYDSETGLYYYRARYFEPKFGRFISEDPIRFAGGMNFYAYAGNNPVTYTDPSGLDITVTEYRGSALNLGNHIGIGVNSSITYGFYPKKGSLFVALGLRVKGEVKIDEGTPIRSFTIKTTAEQDQKVLAYIMKRLAEPGRYSLYGRNCSRFVEAALAAGVIDASESLFPAPAYEEARNKNVTFSWRAFVESVRNIIPF